MVFVMIDVFLSLSLILIVILLQCFGELIGVVVVLVFGGMLFFFYQWNMGSIILEFIDILVGIYEVIVIDDVGCIGMVIVGVVQLEELIVFIFLFMMEDVSCNGLFDGQASVEVIGGIMFFIYEWSNG